MTDWRAAREAVKAGEMVFFPRLTNGNVWSIFANDRKKGLRIAVKKVVYAQCLGSMAWKINEDAG